MATNANEKYVYERERKSGGSERNHKNEIYSTKDFCGDFE